MEELFNNRDMKKYSEIERVIIAMRYAWENVCITSGENFENVVSEFSGVKNLNGVLKESYEICSGISEMQDYVWKRLRERGKE